MHVLSIMCFIARRIRFALNAVRRKRYRIHECQLRIISNEATTRTKEEATEKNEEECMSLSLSAFNINTILFA